MHYEVKEGNCHQIKLRDDLIFDFNVDSDWEIASITWNDVERILITIKRKER